MHPLRELRPVLGPAVVQRTAGGLEAREQLLERGAPIRLGLEALLLVAREGLAQGRWPPGGSPACSPSRKAANGAESGPSSASQSCR